MEDGCRFNTKLLHGKTSTRYGQREILPPVSQVTAFQYESMEELEKVFAYKKMGYAYTRIGNPTLTAFEQIVISGTRCGSAGMRELFIKEATG